MEVTTLQRAGRNPYVNVRVCYSVRNRAQIVIAVRRDDYGVSKFGQLDEGLNVARNIVDQD